MRGHQQGQEAEAGGGRIAQPVLIASCLSHPSPAFISPLVTLIPLLVAALLCLAPAAAVAQKKPKKALKESDARRAIVKMQGFALNSGAVKVKEVSFAGAVPVTALAEVTIGFRFEQVEDETGDLPAMLKQKKWRAVEFRTGDRNWERLDLLSQPVGLARVEGARAALEDLLKEFEASQRENKSVEPLTRGVLTIKQLTALASSLVAEVALEASFRLEKDARGKWRVTEVVFGNDAGGAEVGAIMQAVNAQKDARAREELGTIREALEAFRRERGFYVIADSEVVLMDQLSPRYIARVIRVDPWGRPYRYDGTGERFVLRSDGADGKRDTADDVTLGGG